MMGIAQFHEVIETIYIKVEIKFWHGQHPIKFSKKSYNPKKSKKICSLAILWFIGKTGRYVDQYDYKYAYAKKYGHDEKIAYLLYLH